MEKLTEIKSAIVNGWGRLISMPTIFCLPTKPNWPMVKVGDRVFNLSDDGYALGEETSLPENVCLLK